MAKAEATVAEATVEERVSKIERGELQAPGAITGRRKLPWHYRWPDNIRDDVLARLLALNAERYAEEVALGLQSKGARQAAMAGRSSKVTPRRNSKASAAPPFELTSESYQQGLQLF